MIVELSIKNFAIIEDLKIQFTKGLNLLTGETGAGKSIIVEALDMILGGRASKDLISTGSSRAMLQALFHIENGQKIKGVLEKYGLMMEKDNLLIITREISLNSPSISRINGQIVTLSVLNEVAINLVDIFGQYEHQSLLNVSNHKILIDSFGDNSFQQLKLKIKHTYERYIDAKDNLKDMTMNSSERIRQIDLLEFQIDEINKANLKGDNEEEIENEYNRLSNIKEIIIGVGKVAESFNNSIYEKESIIDSISKNVNILNNLKGFDKVIEPFYLRLESLGLEIQDINNELNRYLSNLEIDEDRLIYLKERIDLVNRLKKKYGNSINEILKYKKEMHSNLTDLINYEEKIEHLKKMIKEYEEEILILSQELSEKRQNISRELEKKISKELLDLNMGKVRFEVYFTKNLNLAIDGFDNIEFMISTNPGEALKPLSRIVSGGEMSRIMLGFKSILAEYDGIPTLIFDEIDTGISGRTSQIVGEKIYNISKKHQVISISHLPQIAALADSHFVISKKIQGDRTISQVDKLSFDERVEEMARLLGGVNVTDTTLSHAKEMLEMSKKIKGIN